MKVLKATVQGGFPIFVGEGARELLLEQVERLAPDRVFVVTDRTVETLHLEEIRAQIPSAVPHDVVLLNEGEENKNLATLQLVAGDLLHAGATPRSLILNAGGGMVLNLGGLAASLLHHGVRFAHVATTVMGQTEVVASNRQAVNLVGDRNALGLYRSPEFAAADPYFLESEPERQRRAALAELARLGLVAGGLLFDGLLELFSQDGFDAPPTLARTVEGALERVLDLGRADPREEARAHAEAYGAEVGRALERVADGKLLAGEARLFGMLVTGEIARALGLMPPAEYQRHQALLAAVKGALAFPQHVRADRVVYQIHGNNKTLLGSAPILLLSGVGRIAGTSNGPDPLRRVDTPDTVMADAIEKARADALL